MAHEITVSWDASVTPGVTYNLYRGNAPGNESPTAYATGVTQDPQSPLTAVAVSTGGYAVYTGTIYNGTSNDLTGMKITVAGFTSSNNNGVFLCADSSGTSLLLANPNATPETNSATAQPRPYFTDVAVLQGHSYTYEITSVSFGVESADSVEVVSPVVPFPPSPGPVQGLAGLASFEVLAGSAATNTGASVIAGDVGVWPGTSLTGFGAPALISGLLHAGDFVAQAAQAALTTAYNDAAGRAGAVALTGDIGGQTLTPGVYVASSSLGITGTLILDAQGNPDAVWVFQIGSTLTTAVNNSNVIVINGGADQNVFWQVGSSATLNGGTIFAGVLMAQASITVNAGVTVNGQLLARTGAVTLDDDTIILRLQDTVALYASNTFFPAGAVIFDCATQTYQQAQNSGTTGATRPAFNPIVGGTTADGTITWVTLDPVLVTISGPLPPSPPNTPPAPPAGPTNPAISSED
jgi:hypothetical protein